MSGNEVLIDTNIALYVLNGDREAAMLVADSDVLIPYIVRMELLSQPGSSRNDIKAIEHFLGDYPLIDLDKSILEEAIVLRRSSGLKLPDAIIAATAKLRGIPLVTSDRDFERLSDVITLLLYAPRP